MFRFTPVEALKFNLSMIEKIHKELKEIIKGEEEHQRRLEEIEK